MTSIAILEAVNTSAVQFHGQPIITAMVAGVAYVALKPIVENLGMSWGTQQQKLMKSMDKFNCIHMNMVAADKKLREVLCIPLRKLNGWLFSINPAKVRDDIRERLVRYQEECFTALHDYWTKGAAIRKPETTVDDRTPLRGIVNRIMGKYGLTYQSVYKLVHKEFGVNHIDELSPKQTAEAVEYLAGKVIEGEFISKNEALPAEPITKQFTDEELNSLCWLWSYATYMADYMLDVEPILRAAEHRLAAPYYSMPRESIRVRNAARGILQRETSHIDLNQWQEGWIVLNRIRLHQLP